MGSRKAIPGIIRPLKNYRGWRKEGTHHKRTIEEKRQAVIRGIERSLRGGRGAPKVEQVDREQGGPVIRVPYASHPLPIFDGEPFAAIDPSCNREQLWAVIIAEIRAGTYDREIEEVVRKVARSLEQKRTLLKAV